MYQDYFLSLYPSFDVHIFSLMMGSADMFQTTFKRGRLKKGLHSFKQHGVDAVAHGVYQQDMVFLNAGGARVGDVEQYVGVFEYGGDFAALPDHREDDQDARHPAVPGGACALRRRKRPVLLVGGHRERFRTQFH